MPYTRKLIYSPTSPLFSLSCTHAHTRTLILILTVCYKPPYPRSQTLVLLNDNPFPRHSPWRYKHRRRTKCIQRNLSCPHTRDIWFRVCLTFISLGDILFSLMVALESKATSFRTTKSKTPACLLTPTCLLRSMAPSIHLGKCQQGPPCCATGLLEADGYRDLGFRPSSFRVPIPRFGLGRGSQEAGRPPCPSLRRGCKGEDVNCNV
jgi:hypothetical protein